MPPPVRRPIRVLPESIVLKIAAGEVIERPASIVKELVENSIDAGAQRIEIRIGDGGRKLISVTDDGIGMAPDEARLALKRHATSKLETAEDLDRIQTLGFRGEALASIAAVSHLDLLTRTETEPAGTRIHCEGGEIRSAEPIGTPPGTTVAVSNLFYNVPARKKFLRSVATELGHIDDIVRRIALSHLDHTLLLESNGEILLNLPAAEDLFQRIRQLYGTDVSRQLYDFEGSDGSSRAYGWISGSRLMFSRPTEVALYVNHRPVRDRLLQAAVMEGFRTAVMERRYPLAVVMLEIPADRVDVNVHPTKAEVRFVDPQACYRLISTAIAQALRKRTLPSHSDLPLAALDRQTPPSPGFERSSMPGSIGTPAELPWVSMAKTPPASYAGEIKETQGYFERFDYLGSLDHTYLVCRAVDSLFVIDQHAAHERILFENLQTGANVGRIDVQNLLMPITLEISQERAAALDQLLPFLVKIGFAIEPFGERTFVVKSVPAVLGQHDPRPLLFDLMDDRSAFEGEAAWQDRVDDVFSRIACHSAVRAHDPLTADEIRSLLHQMDQIGVSTHCPHGRPTFLKFGLNDLERLFGRK